MSPQDPSTLQVSTHLAHGPAEELKAPVVGVRPSLAPRGFRKRELGEEGQAIIEFAITFPWVMLMALAVIQFSLMHLVQNMVDYAAFTCARSATVFVPRFEVLSFGPLGSVDSKPGEVDWSKKFLKIQLAAALPMTAVSPRLTTVGAAWQGLAGSAAAFARFLMNQLPGSLQGIIGGVDRFLYAYLAVSVNAVIPNFGGGVSVSLDPARNFWAFDYTLVGQAQPGTGIRDRGDLFVKVQYIMHLQIPFINYIIAHYFDGTPRNAPTAWSGGAENFFPIGGFARIPYEDGPRDKDDETSQFSDPWNIF